MWERASDLSPYDNAIIALRVSSKYPLNDEELENFKTSVRSHLGYKDILFGTIEQENDNEEVAVTLLLTKRGV